MTDASVEEIAVKLLAGCGYTVSTAESCTGGLVAGCIMNVPGASDVYNAGFITYSNEAKIKYLGVKRETLDKYGAVSEQTAREMAAGTAAAAEADVGLSTTGIAGPGGGTDEKPVGLVYTGCSVRGNVTVRKCMFSGTRQQIRNSAVTAVLELLIESLRDSRKTDQTDRCTM